jgi:hypothetical protein
MSQSDYIQFKRTATLLKENTLNKVLTPREYTRYLQYNLETTVPNTKLQTSRLLPAGKQTVFDMELDVDGCAQFPACTNTHVRSNKTLNTLRLPQPVTYIRLANGKILQSNQKSFTYPTDDCVEPDCHATKSRTNYDAMTYRM